MPDSERGIDSTATGASGSDANATCWVRVGQRIAGLGRSMQFILRIGQEVLVKFIENDIDRPVVTCSDYLRHR